MQKCILKENEHQTLCYKKRGFFSSYVGGLVSKKAADPLDAPPFVTGCLTLLKQYHAENTDIFLAFLGQYVRSLVDSLPG